MSGFDLTRWEITWFIGGAGLACGWLVLMLGRSSLGTRKAPPKKVEAEPSADADPFISGSATEQRASSRRRGRLVRVLVSDDQAGSTSKEGWVVDRSTGGLCIALDRPVPVGAVLSVRPDDAPITMPWVQVEVRTSRAQANGWEHGCAFVKTPPWGVLLNFG